MVRIIDVNGSGAPYPYEAAAFARYDTQYACLSVKTDDELVTAAAGAQVILFTSARFTEDVFMRLPTLRLLVRYGVGYDTVDLAAARRHGVDVCNAPSYGSYDVAEHSFALLMAANRKIPSYDAHIRAGAFGQSADYIPYRLQGKTLGLYGFGRIARHVAAFGHGFGMKTIACDPYCDAARMEATGTRSVDIETLLRASDFLSVNAPLTDETRHILNADAFSKMKPTAVLVNTARGALIDEQALAQALAAGVIRAAGIDVYETYPREPGHPFLALSNIVLTPHVAWNSVESAQALHEEVTAEVVRFLDGQPNLNVVNR